MRSRFLTVAGCILLAAAACAQVPAEPPAQSPTQTGKQDSPDPRKTSATSTAQEDKEGRERILGIIPAFSVSDRQDALPLTPKEKFRLFARGAYDPFTFAAVGLQAGINQAENNFAAYGQGAAGYGKRYAAALADSTDANFMSNFLYPVLLKQDPRYFRLNRGTFKHRLGYAVAQQFSAKTDRGTRQFNWSNVLGAFTAGGISNAYYPPHDRGFGLTVSNALIGMLYGTAGGVFQEFWPDINRKLFHRHAQANALKITPESRSPAERR